MTTSAYEGITTVYQLQQLAEARPQTAGKAMRDYARVIGAPPRTFKGPITAVSSWLKRHAVGLYANDNNHTVKEYERMMVSDMIRAAKAIPPERTNADGEASS